MSHVTQENTTLLLNYDEDQRLYNDQVDEAEIVKSSHIIWAFVALLLSFLVWSYFAELVEVSTGTGKVIPTSREQVIQSLEGGIISELLVREGDIVDAGQVLAQLDLTKTAATVGESTARYRAALASIARLEAEVNQTKIQFPEELKDYPHLVQTETRLYQARKQGLEESIGGLRKSLNLVQQELRLTRSLSTLR